jgi:hypothetical protein
LLAGRMPALPGKAARSGCGGEWGGDEIGVGLEVEHLLEVDAVAEFAGGEAAFVNDAASALDVGAGAAGKIGWDTQGEGEPVARLQAQRAAHEKAGWRDVEGFRGDFGITGFHFAAMKANLDLKRLTRCGALLKILHGRLLARTERAPRDYLNFEREQQNAAARIEVKYQCDWKFLTRWVKERICGKRGVACFYSGQKARARLNDTTW